jgi:1-deoxyxylulose-5-phosphate synthase
VVDAALKTAAGVAVPPVILGTAKLGSVLPDALVSSRAQNDAFRLLDGVLEAGCPSFDIAASYMVGGTERLIGHWIASRRNRDRLFLISKGGHPYPVVAPHRVEPKALDQDLHDSLRRLRTEVIDLYLLHRDDPAAPLEAVVAAFERYKRQGKIRAWGVSNWRHDRIVRIDAIAHSAGGSVAASSPHFSLFEWTTPPWTGCVSIAGESNRSARDFYEKTQIPVLAYAPLGGGFAASSGSAARATYGSAVNGARKKRAEELAKRLGASVTEVALAYVLSQRFPALAIIGVSSVVNMRANLAAAARRLTQEDLDWLERGSS